MLIWMLLIVAIGGLAYIRLAPSQVDRWHGAVTRSEDADFTGGAVRVFPGTQQDLQTLSQIALQTPRTTILAGTPDDGRLTFVTRSLWMGFPDYTTIEHTDGLIRMHARLRFGRSDLGVNRARLEAWKAALQNR